MSFLTGLFGNMLEFLFFHMGDYGMAIVCLTLLVKFCMLPFQIFQRKRLEQEQADPSSCLLLLLQLPVMICLYRSISVGLAGELGTKLFPWVESLLARDGYGILPALSVIVQMIPQLFPYMTFFQSLNLPKPAPGTILSSAVLTAVICFPLPSGVGIYYLVSGLFSAADQAVWNVYRVRRLAEQ